MSSIVKLARHVVCSTLTALLISDITYAQANKAPVKTVLDNYSNGVKAVQGGKFADAIGPLTTALGADGVPRSYREGVYSGEYYPQFYLFVAYAGQKDMVNASRFYTQKGNVPAAVAKDGATAVAALTQWQNDNRANVAFDNFVRQGDAALAQKSSDPKSFDPAIAAYTSAVGLAGIEDSKKRPIEQKLTDAKNQKDAATRLLASNSQKLNDFNAFVARGNAALGNKLWTEAISAFNSAKTTLPDEFARNNLQGKIDEASRGNQADQAARTEFNTLRDRGNIAYTAKNWGPAVDAYNQAKQKLPSDFASQGLQAKLDEATQKKTAVDDFTRLVKDGDAAFGANKWADAATAYSSAKSKLPDEFQSQRLQTKLDRANAEVVKLGDAGKKAEFDSLVKSANAALGAQPPRWQEAASGFNAAKNKLPDEFQKQQLQAKLDQANIGLRAAGDQKAVLAEFESLVKAGETAYKSRKYADAAGKYDAARQKIPDEFNRRGLQAKLDDANRLSNGGGGQASGDSFAHEGLIALLGSGDTTKAVLLLKQAQDTGKFSKPGMNVTVAAYLSVAYASQGLQKNDDSLKQLAKQTFKHAQSLDKSVKLDERLVSPQVRTLLGSH